MSISKQSVVPTHRVSRMLRLGRLATGMAATAFNQGAKQLATGEKPSAAGIFLNHANARRVTAELAKMRGAVMKIGQLLSMEAGDFLPPEVTEILSALRDSAYSMPPAQLHAVLTRAWGEHWRDSFASFNDQPFAAASIGQVHEAVDRDGRRLAIKVQYPGIAASIDSDVDNVTSLLKWFRLIPPGLDIQPLLHAARQQLHDEADYRLEASHLKGYRRRLESHAVFRLPEVVEHLSGPDILAMTFLEGGNIDELSGVHPDLRDKLATCLIDLSLQEFLHWGTVQSDPNFANFLFNGNDNTIGLLDFGALRVNESGRSRSFARLLGAAINKDLAAIIDAACEVGYVKQTDPFNYRMAIADLILTAAEPALNQGRYNFGSSLLSQRLGDKLLYLRNNHEFQRIPPADVIFLHRKLAGMFLLCARINARVDVRATILDYLEQEEQEGHQLAAS